VPNWSEVRRVAEKQLAAYAAEGPVVRPRPQPQPQPQPQASRPAGGLPLDPRSYRLPLVWRPVSGSAYVSLPYARGNRQFLESVTGMTHRQYTGNGMWRLNRSHIRKTVNGLLRRYGEVTLVMDFKSTERCDIRCQTARGDECVCACLARHHGEQAGGSMLGAWRLVGETTLVRSGITRSVRTVHQQDGMEQEDSHA
jgi:hypothetical protein